MALALWRGPALADVGDVPFARVEAVRLEEGRVAALEERIEADLACGRHGELIGDLAALVSEHPLRERLWSQRMLALYRAGRQAEALRSYQDLRRILGEELGIEPSAALRGLEGAILRHDPELDWPGRRPRASPMSVDAEAKRLGLPADSSALLSEPLVEASIPMPALLGGSGGVFVGREPELERLRELWKETSDRQVRVALVAGEPGVGKTRLAAELAREALAQGATVLAGRCDEDLGVPYQPFVEALRGFVEHTPGGELRGRLGLYPGELTRLIPELTEWLPDLEEPMRSDPETERYRLFDAIASWLTTIPVDRPVILVVDDLQWAAKPTLLLFRHVVRVAEKGQLLVVGTFRDTELSRTHPLSELLADLHRTPRLQRLSLSGIDSAAVTAWLEQAAGHRLDDSDIALAQAVHLKTGGNPFFVRELLHQLTDTRLMRDREGGGGAPATEEMTVPEGVRDVVRRRVARLSATANQALSTAAVAGLEFELDVVEHAGGIPGELLVGALEEALAAGLLVEPSRRAVRYRFAHALVRDTLYDHASAARRVRLHRRVAETLETLYGGRLDDHLPALAHHYARAATSPTETDKAVQYTSRAGDRALAQLANDEAVIYYRQALDLLAEGSRDETRRLELLILLGDAQRRAGDPTHRQTLLDAARLAQECGDSDALARAALANDRGTFSVVFEVDAERVAVLETALKVMGKSDSGTRTRLLASLAVELTWATDNERRQELAAEALAMARRLGDPAMLGNVLARRYPVLLPTSVNDLSEYVTEFDTVAATLNDPALGFWAAAWGGAVALTFGQLASFDDRLDTMERFATELGQPLLRWAVTYSRSSRARIAGDLEVAELLAQEALEIGTAAGLPDAVWVYAGNLSGIRHDQGRLGELLGLGQQAAEHRYSIGEAVLALTLCEIGRYDEASRVFEALAVNGFARIPRNFSWLYGLATAAEVCSILGDAQWASVLYDTLAPHRGLVATATSLAVGSVAHYLGLLATTLKRYSAAEDHFAAAADTHARMQAPVWLARTRLEWARMLLIRRQPDDIARANELLDQALATARQLDLATIERRAAALLQER